MFDTEGHHTSIFMTNARQFSAHSALPHSKGVMIASTPAQSESIILTRARELLKCHHFCHPLARAGASRFRVGARAGCMRRVGSTVTIYTRALVGLHTNGRCALALHQQAAADDDTPWQPKIHFALSLMAKVVVHPLRVMGREPGTPPSALVIGSLESQ
jgi:hypothetical protein